MNRKGVGTNESGHWVGSIFGCCWRLAISPLCFPQANVSHQAGATLTQASEQPLQRGVDAPSSLESCSTTTVAEMPG